MLVALGHHPVASHLPVACEQEADLLQRLLFVISRVPIRLASVAHEGTPPSSGTGRPTLRSRGPAVEVRCENPVAMNEAAVPVDPPLCGSCGQPASQSLEIGRA